MANFFQTGTIAAGPANLLIALETFLVNVAGWTLFDDQPGDPVGDIKVFRSPSRVSTDFADVVIIEDAGANFLWVAPWYGSSDPLHWDVGTAYAAQPAVLAGTPGAYLAGGSNDVYFDNAGTVYWFFADEYRFMIVSKYTDAGPPTEYHTGYGGFADSGFTTTADPYPILGKGSFGNTSWNTEGLGPRMFDSANAPEDYSASEPTWDGGASMMEGAGAVQPSLRVAPPTWEALDIILATTGTAGAGPEIRGVPRGVVRVSDDIVPEDTLVLPDGTTFLVVDAYGYGPIV